MDGGCVNHWRSRPHHLPIFGIMEKSLIQTIGAPPFFLLTGALPVFSVTSRSPIFTLSITLLLLTVRTYIQCFTILHVYSQSRTQLIIYYCLEPRNIGNHRFGQLIMCIMQYLYALRWYCAHQSVRSIFTRGIKCVEKQRAEMRCARK